MKIKPQNAPTNNAKMASEESEHQTKQATQQIQAEVEETPKRIARAKKSAQKQHDAQPEVENEPQGLNETQAPAGPGAEDYVPGRRKSDEFAVSVSDAALMHMANRPAHFVADVRAEAHMRACEAERMLCGHIVVIGKVPPVNLARWWRPFELDGLWFVLEPRDNPDTDIRLYELMPSFGPASHDDDVPPQLRRKQRRAPPVHIGPRQRVRRNRDDADGSRGGAVKPSAQQAKGKKKRNGLKRILTELYDSALSEIELLSQKFAHRLSQAWRTGKPRLLRSLMRMRRFGQACGIALHDGRDAVASVVQASQLFRVFFISAREALTRERERAPETFGPSGRLEPSNAGHTISPRLRLNSWNWDEPPLPWADDLFGVLWPPNLFGAREEEVFT